MHWFVDLDLAGNVLEFSPSARDKEKRPKRFALPVNYRLGSPNQFNWLPDFLSGPPNEIFPDGVYGTNTDANREKQAKWCALTIKAAEVLPGNTAIQAVAAFARRCPSFGELPLPPLEPRELGRLLQGFDEGKETLAFRVNGRLAAGDASLKAWWAGEVAGQRQKEAAGMEVGRDVFLDGEGPLTGSFPTVFGNVPLASFDKAPYASFGLGHRTATFRLDAAEKTAAALNALMGDANSRVSLGDATAVFWAAGQQQAVDFLQLLEQPDPLAVRDYLRNVWGASAPHVGTADFHVAVLLKGTGRFSVRSWHTDTLANADTHVRRYFEAIELPTLPFRPNLDPVRLDNLAWATISKAKGKQKTRPPPATFTGLFECAWRGTPVPYPIFAAAVNRQRVEMAGGDPKVKQFWEHFRARVALIQLYFALKPNGTNRRTTMEEIMNSKETAILCGRLLALLDEIHNRAHDGKSASSPANTLYGAAAATPALVFPRLCTLARYHLQKMDKGMAYKLEFGVPRDRRDDGVATDFEGLVAVVAQLKEAAGSDFPRLLSLEDQGRFALGFYYERARRWPNFKKTTDNPTAPEQTPEKEA